MPLARLLIQSAFFVSHVCSFIAEAYICFKMLEKDHFQVIWKADAKYILCEKLDMIPDLEPELMEGTTVAYRCPASKESALQWIQLYQEAANITLTTYDSMSNGQRVVYWARLRCHHDVPEKPSRPRKNQSAKDTGCPLRLKVTVANIPKR
ncbi:uncharacterized protein LOC122374819, partial [Amphibalanus amphitrite]